MSRYWDPGNTDLSVMAGDVQGRGEAAAAVSG
jgi:hypothetical protein